MILKIGNKINFGFTFIEIMLAVVILVIGFTLIYQSFFIILNAFKYYQNYLNILPLINEKIWLATSDLTHFGAFKNVDTNGVFDVGNLKANWNLSYFLLDETEDSMLLEIRFSLSNKDGRQLNIERISYAIFKK